MKKINLKKIFKRNLNRDNLFGLKLSLIIIVFAGIFIFLGTSVVNLSSFPSLLKFDHYLNELVASSRTSLLVPLFLFITAFVSTQASLSVSAAFLAFLFFNKKNRIYFFPFLVSFIGGTFTAFLSKVVFHRARPLDSIYLETSYSFPSGHATMVMVIHTFIFYFLWRQAKSKKMKGLILSFGILFILLIGFSRIYLGVHFFSDIMGGYALGLAWLAAGIGLAEWRLKHRSVKMLLG